jgi:protein HOOK3
LHRPSSAIDVPDLQAVAKDGNVEQTLAICRLTIAIAVQSEKNKDVIERIQRLSQSDQHALMRAIEQVHLSSVLGLIAIDLYRGEGAG